MIIPVHPNADHAAIRVMARRLGLKLHINGARRFMYRVDSDRIAARIMTDVHITRWWETK